ncbi:MAG: hypothetical protein JJT81_11630, partial [Rubellimicrobium sp.]|nr:hypothetical protein [Rubellimicrobium sp.]
ASRLALLAHCVSYGVNALYEKPNPYSASGVNEHGLQVRLAQANRLVRATCLALIVAASHHDCRQPHQPQTASRPATAAGSPSAVRPAVRSKSSSCLLLSGSMDPVSHTQMTGHSRATATILATIARLTLGP